jgi:hypothetical protein
MKGVSFYFATLVGKLALTCSGVIRWFRAGAFYELT